MPQSPAKNVRAKAETGPAGSSALAAPQTAYEKIRIKEIGLRAQLYATRLAKLKANLLDRKEVEMAYTDMMSAVKQVISQSRLSKAEKADIFGNLVEPGQFVANVTQRQAQERSPTALNGGIDQEL